MQWHLVIERKQYFRMLTPFAKKHPKPHKNRLRNDDAIQVFNSRTLWQTIYSAQWLVITVTVSDVGKCCNLQVVWYQLPCTEGSSSWHWTDHILTSNSCASRVCVCSTGCNSAWLPTALVWPGNVHRTRNTTVCAKHWSHKLARACGWPVSQRNIVCRCSCSCGFVSCTTCTLWQHSVAATLMLVIAVVC